MLFPLTVAAPLARAERRVRDADAAARQDAGVQAAVLLVVVAIVAGFKVDVVGLQVGSCDAVAAEGCLAAVRAGVARVAVAVVALLAGVDFAVTAERHLIAHHHLLTAGDHNR